jgi:hypothetical protein
MTRLGSSDSDTPPPDPAQPGPGPQSQPGGGTSPGDPWGSVPARSGLPQYGASQPGAPQYGAPQYGPPPGYPPQYPYGYPYGYPPRGGTNGMAIAAMVCGICGFLCLVPGIVGIILGFISLPQIKRSQQSGRGMAIAGIVVGALWIVLFIVLIAVSSGNQPNN